MSGPNWKRVKDRDRRRDEALEERYAALDLAKAIQAPTPAEGMPALRKSRLVCVPGRPVLIAREDR